MPRRVKGYSQSLPTKDTDSEGSDLEAGVGSDEDFSGHAMNDEVLRTKAYDAPNIPDGGGRSVSNKKKGGISLKKIAIGLALVVAAVVASIFVIPMFFVWFCPMGSLLLILLLLLLFLIWFVTHRDY